MPRDELKQLLAANVRALKHAKRMGLGTQTRIAEAASRSGKPIDQKTVSRIENAATEVQLDTIEALAAAYQIEAHRLLMPNLGDLPEVEFVQVRRVAVSLSAGRGQVVFDESDVSPLSFQATYLRQQGVSAKNAVVVNVTGRSMEPDIPSGAVLLVNTAATEIVNGKVYAFRRERELLVKHLYKRDGAIEAISANQDRDEFPNIRLAEGVDFNIIGRAIWMGASL